MRANAYILIWFLSSLNIQYPEEMIIKCHLNYI